LSHGAIGIFGLVGAAGALGAARAGRLADRARSWLVGAYMVFDSMGSAGGAIASTAASARAGWTGVCLLGAAISGTALALWAMGDD
jgi:hypothetical protein